MYPGAIIGTTNDIRLGSCIVHESSEDSFVFLRSKRTGEMYSRHRRHITID